MTSRKEGNFLGEFWAERHRNYSSTESIGYSTFRCGGLIDVSTDVLSGRVRVCRPYLNRIPSARKKRARGQVQMEVSAAALDLFDVMICLQNFILNTRVIITRTASSSLEPTTLHRRLSC